MNQVVRMQPPGAPPAVGDRSGSFVWNGTCWVPDPCCDGGAPGFPCPPPGWPPPGCPPWWSGQNSPPWYPGANAGVSFGATPPQNPVRGHFWWDGTSLWMFDGAAWDVVGGGSAAGNTPPQANPPANPVPGQQWFNGSTLFVWDGNAWIPVSQTKTYIQATQPPAPNPGDLWWDGTVMRIWSGSAWDLVGPGATVGPVPTTTKVFQIGQPAGLTIPANTWTVLPLTTTPTIDPQGMWDPVTHRITPKLPGNYLWRTIGENGGTTFGSCILKNDQGSFDLNNLEKIALWDISATSVAGWWIGMGISVFNGTTDFARLWGYTSSGSVGPIGPSPIIEAWLLP